MNELTLIIAGLGGQGVQMLAKVLANAAIAEGKQVMLAAEYGGEMRGGRSFASIVIGDGKLQCLPVVEVADAALILHDKHWEESDRVLKPGGLAFVEAEFMQQVSQHSIQTSPPRKFVGFGGVACAKSVGSALGGGLALLGGFCAYTNLAKVDNLVAAMTEITPSYRRQHVVPNERAIRSAAAMATQRGAFAA